MQNAKLQNAKSNKMLKMDTNRNGVAPDTPV